MCAKDRDFVTWHFNSSGVFNGGNLPWPTPRRPPLACCFFPRNIIIYVSVYEKASVYEGLRPPDPWSPLFKFYTPLFCSTFLKQNFEFCSLSASFSLSSLSLSVTWHLTVCNRSRVPYSRSRLVRRQKATLVRCIDKSISFSLSLSLSLSLCLAQRLLSTISVISRHEWYDTTMHNETQKLTQFTTRAQNRKLTKDKLKVHIGVIYKNN